MLLFVFNNTKCEGLFPSWLLGYVAFAMIPIVCCVVCFEMKFYCSICAQRKKKLQISCFMLIV
jgi:hypothetical protein